MNAEKSKRAITVGIFIFLGIAILTIGVLTLGGQRKTFDKTFIINAVFDDVSGLQAGNNIWFAGVKVGTVKKLALSGNGQVNVTMNVDQNAEQFIHKDAKVKISTDGLIGNKIIVIYGGTQSAPVIKSGNMLIVERVPGTDDMMSTFQENNKNLLAITNDIKLISGRILEGKGTIGRLLNDETLMNRLQGAVATLNTVSLNAQRFTSNLDAYTAKLHTKGTLANDFVTDTVIVSQLRSTVIQFQQASATANVVADNLKQATGALNNKDNPAGMLLHDQEAAANMKSILQNLQSGSQKLNDDLEALQHNFLFRGFFKKKAKAEAQEVKENK